MVVASVGLVHTGRVPNPATLVRLLDGARGGADLISIVFAVVANAGRRLAEGVWWVLGWLCIILGFAGHHVASGVSSGAVDLSNRPLALFARPAFAFFAAVVDVFFSLTACVLSDLLPFSERAELAARAGRSSQRFGLVPVLGAAVCTKFVARIMPLVVCLAVLYMLLSLWAFADEMSTWRDTQRARPRHTVQARGRVQARAEVFCHLTKIGDAARVYMEHGTACSVCLEPLVEELSSDEPLESLDSFESVDSWKSLEPLEPLSSPEEGRLPQRVSVCVSLRNGPRDFVRQDILASLQVWAVDPSEPAVISDSTRSGAWRLTLSEACTYTVSLIHSNHRTQAPIQTSFLLHVALPSATAASSGSSEASVVLRQGCEETWTFPGKRGRVQNEMSALTFRLVGETMPIAEPQVSESQVPEAQAPEFQAPAVQSVAPSETKEDDVVALPCGHPFHRPCIEQWLVQKMCCPLCRQRFDVRGRRMQALF